MKSKPYKRQSSKKIKFALIKTGSQPSSPDEGQYSLYDHKDQYRPKQHQRLKIRPGRPISQANYLQSSSHLLCDGNLTLQNDHIVFQIIQSFINYCSQCDVKNFQSLNQHKTQQIDWTPEEDYQNFIKNIEVLKKIEYVFSQNKIEKELVKVQFIWVLVYLRGLISLFMMEQVTNMALELSVIRYHEDVLIFAEKIFFEENSGKGLYCYLTLKMSNKYKTIAKAIQNTKTNQRSIYQKAFINFILRFWQCLRAVLVGHIQETVIKKQQQLSQE